VDKLSEDLSKSESRLQEQLLKAVELEETVAVNIEHNL